MFREDSEVTFPQRFRKWEGMMCEDWGQVSQPGRGRTSTQMHRWTKGLNVTDGSSCGPSFSAKPFMNYLLVSLLRSFFNIIIKAIIFQVPTMGQALLNALCILLLILHKNTALGLSVPILEMGKLGFGVPFQ